MGSLITNKRKQAKCSAHDEPPSRWDKQQVARPLRRDSWDWEAGERTSRLRSLDRGASRNRRDRCPVCEAELRKIVKGTRYQRNGENTDFFEFENEIEKMQEAYVLYLVVLKFADVDLHLNRVQEEKT